MISRIPAAVLLLANLSLVLADQTTGSIDPQPEDFADFVADITDPTTPLPSCETVGVQEVLGCMALCEAISGGSVDTDNTRDSNGNFVCTCENMVACNDQPTCAQLLILPGRVEEACTSFCGTQFMAFEDKVQYAGDISTGNKDLTHFVVECRCDGNVECSDAVLFSDLAYPITCTSLGVDSEETCDSYCTTESGGLFDLGGNYTVKEGTSQGTCECQATSVNALRDKDVAQACTDIPSPAGPQACSLQNPCPTQAPNAQSSGWYPPTSAAVVAAGLTLGLV